MITLLNKNHALGRVIRSIPVVVACFDYAFMAGTMGSVVGDEFRAAFAAPWSRKLLSLASLLRPEHGCRRACFRSCRWQNDRRVNQADRGWRAFRASSHLLVWTEPRRLDRVEL